MCGSRSVVQSIPEISQDSVRARQFSLLKIHTYGHSVILTLYSVCFYHKPLKHTEEA